MAIVDGHGIPLAATIHSASPAECKLAPETLREIPGWLRPDKLIGDKAYDSAPLAYDLMADYHVELISPHRATHTSGWQDGRKLRRYKRRWKVERFFAWLFNFRRLTTRWEYHAHNFGGFLALASIVIILRHL
jgi:transposase